MMSLLALVVAMPIIVVMLTWLIPEHELWRHFSANLLSSLISSTAILLLGVGILKD
jgi:iron(III) transport system permease protein